MWQCKKHKELTGGIGCLGCKFSQHLDFYKYKKEDLKLITWVKEK